MKKSIIKIYEESLKTNMKDIDNIFTKLKINNSEIMLVCENILSSSTKHISNKWITDKKYARTFFSAEAFGKYYPKKNLQLSIIIDGIVNILDDLFDEDINKKTKSLYIIELLRIFSLYNLQVPEKKIQISFGHYFNQLISLAIAEDCYRKKIKKIKNINTVVNFSLEIFSCRSMDIDIFNDIALVDYKEKNDIEKIKNMARIFRAVNILKKDISDIDYDIKNNMETVITIMRKNKEYDFFEYVNQIITAYINSAEKIKLSIKKNDLKTKTPIDNYFKMIQKDKIEIIKMI